MTKHEKVQGTKDMKPNRAQRRHPERVDRPEHEPLSRDDQALQAEAEDQRAQNSDAGKNTADKWNQ